MSEFVKVTTTADIPEGEMRAFKIGLDGVVICHTASGYYAVTDECSHDSAPISDGQLDGQQIVCCRHGARFDVTDGSVQAPPALVGIDHFELKIEDDNILVKLH